MGKTFTNIAFNMNQTNIEVFLNGSKINYNENGSKYIFDKFLQFH